MENIDDIICDIAEEIAKRSVPEENEPFTAWSNDALHCRVQVQAAKVLMEILVPLLATNFTTSEEPEQGDATI